MAITAVNSPKPIVVHRFARNDSAVIASTPGRPPAAPGISGARSNHSGHSIVTNRKVGHNGPLSQGFSDHLLAYPAHEWASSIWIFSSGKSAAGRRRRFPKTTTMS